MQKQTIVDQIEIARDGTIGIRMAKEVIDDDGTARVAPYLLPRQDMTSMRRWAWSTSISRG
jgi:hypothetical protein